MAGNATGSDAGGATVNAHTSQCTICGFDDEIRQAIDRQLLEGDSRTGIADEHGISRSAVHRHLKWLLSSIEDTTPPAVQAAVQHLALLIATSTAELERWRDLPDDERMPADLERLIRSVLAPLKVELGRLGVTTDRAAVDVSGHIDVAVHADALAVAQQIHEALMPFPDARAAVAQALEDNRLELVS